MTEVIWRHFSISSFLCSNRNRTWLVLKSAFVSHVLVFEKNALEFFYV